LDEIRSQALANSPDLRAAESALQQAGYGIKAARGAYYPSLVVDYFYGFDANVFNIIGPDDRHNLGSVVQATVNVPVWNWGATRSKVRQAELQQRQAQYDLTFAQRQLQVNISTFYLEAQAALAQIQSLRSSLDLATESLRLTVLRYQGGEATALEVADAQTTLVQARNAYDDGLARYRLALVEIQTLTGRF
jgi:outer membrane protein TolC